MQRSKHSARRLLLASAATALVLAGCEQRQVDQMATTNNPATYPAKSKSEGEKKVVAQGQAAQQGVSALQAPASGPPILGIAPAPSQGGLYEADANAYGYPAAAPLPGEGENYATIEESSIKQVAEAPVSTSMEKVETGASAACLIELSSIAA